MTTPDFHAKDMDELAARWRTGDFVALAEAFQLCAWREQPVPEWLQEPVVSALLFAFNHGGADHGGRGGGFRTQTQLSEMHRTRANAYAWALLEGERGAAQRASDLLLGSRAWGTARQVKRSYEKVISATNRG